MQHANAMTYLAEQRSEELIRQAERHNRAAGLRPARSGLFSRLRRRLAGGAHREPSESSSHTDWRLSPR